MRISPISRAVAFGSRPLNIEEQKEYESILKQGKEIIGLTGHDIFIMPSQSLPQAPDKNTGIGHLTSKTEQEYIKYMHTMLGFNVLEDLPSGQIEPYPNDFYCNYRSTSIALGDHQINPFLLTTPEYSNLLTEDEAAGIVKSNTRNNNERFANFQNIMGEDGGMDKALKKAYERFEQLEDSTPLKQAYKKFKEQNSEWIDFLYKDKGEFFKFKQFLAESHLKKSREFLNSIGVKYCGDCLIGATDDEVKAKMLAFDLDNSLGWVLPIPKFKDIENENTDAHRYLKYKVQNMARRYDMIRFDVGWAYIQPRLINNNDNSKIEKPYFGDKILSLIENWVKEVKGDDYDPKNLIWEFEAGPGDFDWEKDGKVIDPINKRVKILSTMYMSDNWGSNKAYAKRGFDPEYSIVGVGNHDHQPLAEIANDIPYPIKDANGNVSYTNPKADSVEPLAKLFNLDKDFVNVPQEYAKAKAAEAMTGKNTMAFFMDTFGYKVRFDKHSFNCEDTPNENYAHKVLYDFKKQYHEAVESGYGANKMDSLEKIFKIRGLDKKHPVLYASIVKYRDFLYEQEPSVEIVSLEELIENKDEASLKPKIKNRYLLPIIAAGAVILGAGAYYYTKSHEKSASSTVSNSQRPSLVKTA